MALPLVRPLMVMPLLAALAVSGCSGIGESMSMPSFFGGTDKPKEAVAVGDEFKAKPSCPLAEVRDGAEVLQFYEAGKTGDPASVRYQASVQRVARDCDVNDLEVVVKVGVAGRVAAGPKGGPGVVQVPLRIAVTGDKGQVIYSKLHIVPVSIEAPDYSALWSQVDEQVRIPRAQAADASIYVGLDEQGLKGGVAQQKPKKKG